MNFCIMFAPHCFMGCYYNFYCSNVSSVVKLSTHIYAYNFSNTCAIFQNSLKLFYWTSPIFFYCYLVLTADNFMKVVSDLEWKLFIAHLYAFWACFYWLFGYNEEGLEISLGRLDCNFLLLYNENLIWGSFYIFKFDMVSLSFLSIQVGCSWDDADMLLLLSKLFDNGLFAFETLHDQLFSSTLDAL